MGWGDTSGIDYNQIREEREKQMRRDRERHIFYPSKSGTIYKIDNFRVYLSGSKVCVVAINDTDESGCIGDAAIDFINTNKERVLFIDPDGKSMETYMAIKGTYPIFMLVCTGYVRPHD